MAMGQYIIRLDDACEKMDVEKWSLMEDILDRFQIIPLVGVIPYCKDLKMEDYPIDPLFWDNKVHSWINKNWTIALHGYEHQYVTESGGINPINRKSEFAGLPLDLQREKIAKGIEKFKIEGIDTNVFFAPSHTFDDNTVLALKEESKIKYISDTPTNDIYSYLGITFVPVQFSFLRKSPYKVTTFCLHPNTMKKESFERVTSFLEKEYKKFICFPTQETKRKQGLIDKCVRSLYFKRRGIKV